MTNSLYKLRSWYFIPFIVGCVVEAIGYTGRVVSAGQDAGQWSLGPYVIQALLLLLGPPFFAASIYMVLGRLIRLLQADRHSIVRLNWLTKIFLVGDIVSIIAQAMGGGILSGANSSSQRNKAQAIIITGLFIQLIFFGFFIIVTIIFHRRINREPTTASLKIRTPWRTLLFILYLSSGLIMARSAFRVIEYIMGEDGELMAKEAYIYSFDGLLMLAVTISFGVFHPSAIINKDRNMDLDSENQLGTYNQA
ncbi:rta1 domain-containing protein [Fusarium mexicanum]|uniref:Rta1 domain-containing protein n=1 Tax=Fusarium mexicanum TaxID=751941 RepID=A0A8H5II13_9HYPO|nr:rta1 domain-containing protein [Fusarium mexicanum]